MKLSERETHILLDVSLFAFSNKGKVMENHRPALKRGVELTTWGANPVVELVELRARLCRHLDELHNDRP